MYNKGTWIIINATSKLSHGYNTVYISPYYNACIIKNKSLFRKNKYERMEVLQVLRRSVYHIQANNSFHVVLN